MRKSPQPDIFMFSFYPKVVWFARLFRSLTGSHVTVDVIKIWAKQISLKAILSLNISLRHVAIFCCLISLDEEWNDITSSF